MEIYVVVGTTGEYSDRREWAVKAFSNEDRAKDFVLEATKIAKELFVSKKRYSDDMESPLDPEIQMDYTGTDYFYYTVNLED